MKLTGERVVDVAMPIAALRAAMGRPPHAANECHVIEQDSNFLLERAKPSKRYP